MSAEATTPPLAWRGAERLVILCNVSSSDPLRGEEAAAELCSDIKRLAEAKSPIPVTVVGFGDAALVAAGAVALLVHASISPASTAVPGASGQILSFSMRTHREASLAEGGAYFGAAPRVAPYGRPNGRQSLDAALSASLSEVLPWLSRGDTNLLQQ